MGSDWSKLLRPTPRRIIEAMVAGAGTLTEISEATGLSKPALTPHLKELAALGAVDHERVPTATGTEARYRLNSFSLHLSLNATRRTIVSWSGQGEWDIRFPLLAQVPQQEVRVELAAFLAALESRAPQDLPITVLVYGSAARGQATWKSDIDLIVLSDSPALQRLIDEAAYHAQTQAQHTIRPVITTTSEFKAARKRIYAEAVNEGFVVWTRGGEDAPWPKMEKHVSISI